LPTPPPRSRILAGLGGRLRSVREQAGLTGAELAETLGAGWLQSKVSKIETGRQLPTAEDVRAWASATNVDPEPLLTLRVKAAADYKTFRERLAEAGGRLPRQDEITALVTSCTFLASYVPAMIPGDLQTPAYIRELAQSYQRLTGENLTDDEIGHIVAAKLRRQAIMYEPGREIVHVVGEAALRTRIGGMSVPTLRAQLQHLVEMSELPGHTFGVIPFSAITPFTPLSGWAMYDRDLVVIETLDGSIQLTEPTVLARYSRWLDQLLDVALTGPDAAAFCRTIADSLEE
jgi:transcriptional regulator with XRE-family HTH domain